ncbi:hypothetical protein Q3G72_015355 [Acer saccharum]|nr:hypothetical protein Q3G72_015355 [Acer saccharum]
MLVDGDANKRSEVVAVDGPKMDEFLSCERARLDKHKEKIVELDEERDYMVLSGNVERPTKAFEGMGSGKEINYLSSGQSGLDSVGTNVLFSDEGIGLTKWDGVFKAQCMEVGPIKKKWKKAVRQGSFKGEASNFGLSGHKRQECSANDIFVRIILNSKSVML